MRGKDLSLRNVAEISHLGLGNNYEQTHLPGESIIVIIIIGSRRSRERLIQLIGLCAAIDEMPLTIFPETGMHGKTQSNSNRMKMLRIGKVSVETMGGFKAPTVGLQRLRQGQ